MKTIGIIGGMGPLATSDLYRRIIARTKAAKDQDHIHVLIDSNTRIPDRTEAIIGNGEDPRPELIKSAERLEQGGADFLIMPCNTAHYFIDAIQAKVHIPFINMIEETAKDTKQKYGQETVVGIMATDGTLKTKIYEHCYHRLAIKIVVPEKKQQKLMKFIYEVIKNGNYDAGTDLFFECVEELKNKGADAFLLGCTELSSAQYLYKFEGPFINPTEILAEASIIRAGGQLNECHSNRLFFGSPFLSDSRPGR
ncbi:aspartate/glutamate racemase family protein [Sporolactobacillus sp. KGMB 08714]|uniref:aspartate/glutamate racemase family protein n=1 Tax=Sporolactobacillus sp. KGMB 08714 TaxID=3064704 RepID=UPI002FBD65A9